MRSLKKHGEKNMTFKQWLNTFISEKNINRHQHLEVEGECGTNIIPLDALLETICNAPKHERDQIKKQIVFLDFKNADVMDYFKHLAKAIAI